MIKNETFIKALFKMVKIMFDNDTLVYKKDVKKMSKV